MRDTLNPSTNGAHSLSDAWAVGIIIGVGLAAHGILLLTNFIVWDGWWLIQELIYGRRFDLLLAYTQEFGRPMDYLYWRFLGLFPKPEVAIKFLALISWIVAAVFMFRCFRLLGGLSTLTACALAALFAACPAYKMMGESILFMNTISIAVFWFAWWVHARTVVAPNAWSRIISSLLFVVSFNLNSLLVFFYAVGLAFLLLKAKSCSPRNVGPLFLQRIRQFPELPLLPVLYWIAKSVFLPSSGHHLDYNKPSFAPSLLIEGYRHMWEHLLLSGATSLVESPVMVVAVAVVAVLLAANFTRSPKSRVVATSPDPFGVMCIAGVGLLLAAALPYIAVNQNLAAEGWLSRNSILVGMPIAMVFVGGFGWVCVRFRLPSASWIIAAAILCALFVIRSNRNVLELEALSAKQESLRQKLRSAVQSGGVSVVQLRDYFGIPGTIPYYPPIIWTYLVAHGDERPRAFVIDVAGIAPPEERIAPDGSKQFLFPALPMNSALLTQLMDQTTMPWLLGEVPLTGPQIMFIVQPGKLGNDGVSLGAKYLRLKWFNPGGLPEFLDQVTETHVLELPPVAST